MDKNRKKRGDLCKYIVRWQWGRIRNDTRERIGEKERREEMQMKGGERKIKIVVGETKE